MSYETDREALQQRLGELHMQIVSLQEKVTELEQPVAELATADPRDELELAAYLAQPADNGPALARAKRLMRTLEQERMVVSHELGALERRQSAKVAAQHVLEHAGELRRAAAIMSEHRQLCRHIATRSLLADNSGDILKVVAYCEQHFGH